MFVFLKAFLKERVPSAAPTCTHPYHNPSAMNQSNNSDTLLRAEELKRQGNECVERRAYAEAERLYRWKMESLKNVYYS
jgi:hypothetical protein